MGWLIGPAFFSAIAAFLAVRIFDFIFGGVTSNLASAARAGVFVSAWTAVTTGTGMRGLNKRVRRLRRHTTGVLDALTSRKR